MTLKENSTPTSPYPLFVVGMPRSGSTIFTRLLNESSDLFIVNDFYYLQYVDSLRGFENNSETVNQQLAAYVLKLIKARIERPDSPAISCGLMLCAEDEAKIEKFVAELDCTGEQNWASILEQIMQFSASLLGKKTWGYNTPQDYLNIDLLLEAYPNAKIVFVMRDPRSMLRSYKYIFTNAHNTTQRYHPVLQSLAWRTSIRSYFDYQAKYSHNILLVRYEDLVAKTSETLDRVGNFVGAKFSDTGLDKFGNNSSFKDKKAKNLNDTETWLCERVAAVEMERLGHTISQSKPRLQDALSLISLTANAAFFYISKTLTSDDIRKRVFKLVKKA